MPYRQLYHSTTADASDVNDNFYYIAQGTRFPYSNGMSPTTNSSSLGNTASSWNNLYASEVLFQTNTSFYQYTSASHIGNTTGAITYTINNIQGDTYPYYKLLCSFITTTVTTAYVEMTFNYTISSGTHSSIYIPLFDEFLGGNSQNSIFFGSMTTNTYWFDDISLYFKTGMMRMGHINHIEGSRTNGSASFARDGVIGFNNSTETITTIYLYVYFGRTDTVFNYTIMRSV